jgi:hypothetical protein
MSTDHPNIGSSLNDFPKEEGIYEEVRAIAVKEGLDWLAEQAIQPEPSTPQS